MQAGSMDLVDRHFLEKFHEARRRKLPIDSDFYQYMEKHHAMMREHFDKRWRDTFPKELPQSTIEFYNAIFARMDKVIQKHLKSSDIPEATKQRAQKIYAYRLPTNATFKELCDYDAFVSQTFNIDLRVHESLGGMKNIAQDKLEAINYDVGHSFLHRAQQTEYLFLHEIFVGHLVNLEYNKGVVPKTWEDLNPEKDYWPMSAYVFNVISKMLVMKPEDLIGLHVAESSYVNQKLPEALRDLSLIASHIFWYMDFCQSVTGSFSVSRVLHLLQTHFFLPSLTLIEAGKAKRLSQEAGRETDRVLYKWLLQSIADAKAGTTDAPNLDNLLKAFVKTVWA